MYNGDITDLHFEPTSACNARCPQCPRTFKSSFNTHPFLKIEEWTAEELEKVLNHKLFKNLKTVLINGNFGDIVMHTDPKSIIEVFLKRNLFITINTNGGALSLDFWKWLGKQKNVVVKFGIDGLKDTNHLYRRNTNFDRIIENAKAFISTGGSAHWIMTLFKHNMDQVEQCKEYARLCNFEFFSTRESFRFSTKKLSVMDKNFNHEYFIEPCNTDGINDEIEYLDKNWYTDRQDPGFIKTISHKKTKHSDSVFCVASDNNSVFLSYDKRLWPCCHTAIGFEQAFKQNSMYDNITEIFKESLKTDYYFNNVTKFSIDKIILEDKIFENIAKTWNTKNVCTSCIMNCKKDSHQFKQFRSSKVLKISEN